MSYTETLSAEDKAYFDTRGEAVTTPVADAPAVTNDDPAPDIADDLDDDGIDAPVADDPVDPDKPTGQSKVPLAALTKERQARKAEAARAAEAERKAAILEDRWNQALQRDQQQEKPTAVDPAPLDPSQDPLAVVNELLSDLNQRKKSEADQKREAAEQQAAEAAWNKTLDVAKAQYNEAAGADETFEPTYTALRMNIAQEFMDVYGLTEQQAIAEVNQYEAQQVAIAVNRGLNVADHMRKIAKARNVSAVPTAKAADPSADLDKIAEGVSGSTSLSTAGGGRVASTSAQSIADMSPDEFAAWLGKDGNQAKFKKLAGG